MPLGPCASCGAPARYRCPACAAESCSLACVKAHKSSTSCTGKRDAAAFREMRDFDDDALLRDYNFLEGAMRSVDSAARRARETGPMHPSGGISPARRELLRHATARDVRLQLLPHGMARMRENTSRYDARRRKVRWRVELIFAGVGVRHVEAAVDELTQLSNLLRTVLGIAAPPTPAVPEAEQQQPPPPQQPPRPSQPQQQQRTPTEVEARRALARPRLRLYADASAFPHLRFYLPATGRRADDPRYHRLPPERTLADLLRGKNVIEFPTVHVAMGEDEFSRFQEMDAGAPGPSSDHATS